MTPRPVYRETRAEAIVISILWFAFVIATLLCAAGKLRGIA